MDRFLLPKRAGAETRWTFAGDGVERDAEEAVAGRLVPVYDAELRVGAGGFLAGRGDGVSRHDGCQGDKVAVGAYPGAAAGGVASV